MNAAGMREGVLADNRLASLHGQPAHPRHEAGRLDNLRRVDAAFKSAEKIAPRFERHDDLFHRRVAGPFANAIDRAFHLARALGDRRKGIGNPQPQIIMAMHADRCRTGPELRHRIAKMPDECPILLRHRPAHRVREVHRGGTGGNDRFADFHEELRLCSRRVFGRKLHVIREGLGPFDTIYREP